MTAASLLAYALALVLAVATPGPAMVALIARSVARGARAGLRMALGIAVADVVLGALTLLGLAALLASYAWLLIVLKYAGAPIFCGSGSRCGARRRPKMRLARRGEAAISGPGWPSA
jgi:threonine/homoserine/homoserine lactone efflux protein